MERMGQTAEAPAACVPAVGRTQSVTKRRLYLRATFLNVSIISNCVKLPFPKGLPSAARALMLIGQIVFGFETQTVINETTVNEFGPRWFHYLASPADTDSRRLCHIHTFLTTVPGLEKLASWSENNGSFDLMPSLRSVSLLPSFRDGKIESQKWRVLSKALMQGEGGRARVQPRTRVLF